MLPNDTTPEDTDLKRCSKCRKWLPATSEHFHVSKSEKCGLCSRCRHCRNKRSILVARPGFKVCRKCLEEKPANTQYFHVKKHADGLSSHCKSCVHDHRQANKQEIYARDRERHLANPEKRHAKDRLYRINYPEKVAAKERRRKRIATDETRMKNRIRYSRQSEARRQRRIEYERSYAEANPDKLKAKGRKWRLENPERVRAQVAARRARVANAPGTHTAADIKRQHQAQKGKCYWCNEHAGKSYHVDHVIPLSRGGSNGPENIVIACQFCNDSKGTKLPTEWDGSNKLL